MSPQPVRPLVQALLDDLRREEDLLRTARETVMGLYAALRKGDLPAVEKMQPAQERLAADMLARAADREAAAAALAANVGLPPTATLTELAEKLPPALAETVRKARTDLRALTRQVEQFQSANANLIAHLRSYFRGVLNGLTATDTPTRYGPTGAVISGQAGAALRING